MKPCSRSWARGLNVKITGPIAMLNFLNIASTQAILDEVGYGIRVRIGDRLVRVGSDRYMAREEIDVPDAIRVIKEACHAEGRSLVMMAVDGRPAGRRHRALAHPPPRSQAGHRQVARPRSPPGRHLRRPGTTHAQDGAGVRHRPLFREYLAQAALIEQKQREGRVACFVGDGTNDAIALKTANVSISLQGATTAGTGTAQIVLMGQSLRPAALSLPPGRRFRCYPARLLCRRRRPQPPDHQRSVSESVRNRRLPADRVGEYVDGTRHGRTAPLLTHREDRQRPRIHRANDATTRISRNATGGG